jgi:hypothetical protein
MPPLFSIAVRRRRERNLSYGALSVCAVLMVIGILGLHATHGPGATPRHGQVALLGTPVGPAQDKAPHRRRHAMMNKRTQDRASLMVASEAASESAVTHGDHPDVKDNAQQHLDERHEWKQQMASWRASPKAGVEISSEVAEGVKNQSHGHHQHADQLALGQTDQAATQSVRIPFYDRSGYRRFEPAASRRAVAC